MMKSVHWTGSGSAIMGRNLRRVSSIGASRAGPVLMHMASNMGREETFADHKL